MKINELLFGVLIAVACVYGILWLVLSGIDMLSGV
jgi:hypothetical protein